MNRYRKTSILFVALTAIACGCEEKVKHLVCYDETGAVIVDTTDLRQPPHHTETAWTWHTKGRTEYHQISVPPHKCTYEEYEVGKKPSTQQPKAVLAEAPE